MSNVSCCYQIFHQFFFLLGNNNWSIQNCSRWVTLLRSWWWLFCMSRLLFRYSPLRAWSIDICEDRAWPSIRNEFNKSLTRRNYKYAVHLHAIGIVDYSMGNLVQFIVTRGTCPPAITDDILNGDRDACIRAICMSNEQARLWLDNWQQRTAVDSIIFIFYQHCSVSVLRWLYLVLHMGHVKFSSWLRDIARSNANAWSGSMLWSAGNGMRMVSSPPSSSSTTSYADSISDWVYEIARTQPTK